MASSNTKNRTILSVFLQKMKVKHTVTYANKLYNEHPHKYNLFGLSLLLSDYKIANAGIKIEDKNLSLLDIPFIAQAGGDFVTVYKIDSKDVYCVWRGKHIRILIDEFKKSWSGIALIAEPDGESIEPNYKENKKRELASVIQSCILLFVIGVLGMSVFLQGELYKSIGLVLSLIFNLTGIYISYLLILKQMHIQSENADKICSLFRKSECNNILESPAAKFMGIISWSEVGLGYFISNTIILLFVPYLIPLLALVNLLALPYSFWSIWYQNKAKEWCPLCLVVQILLWGIFVVNLASGFVQPPDFTLTYILFAGSIYAIPFLIINTTLPSLTKSRKAEKITQEINSLRMKDEVFMALLKKQPYYRADKSTSRILFGNSDSKIMITILTNPHCEPCSKMHKRIEKLLDETGDRICVQYIFSSFHKELDVSNKFLSAVYFNKSTEEVRYVYNEWFEDGKHKKEDTFKKYNLNIEASDVIEEFSKHQAWKEETKLRATPTILINGYELNDNYKIEDIKYFLDLVVDTQ